MSVRGAPVATPPVEVPADVADLEADCDNGALIYHQTVIPTQAISHVVEGSFSMPGASEMVVIRHSEVIELWSLQEGEVGGAECVASAPLFARIYAAVAVSTSDSNTSGITSGVLGDSADRRNLAEKAEGGEAQRSGVHYIAVTSETGYVSLFKFHLLERRFIKLSEVSLGRSGPRLTVPGARMAVDAGGRALFITALVRNKVVVPLHHKDDSSASSPIRFEQDGTGVDGVDLDEDEVDHGILADDEDAPSGGGPGKNRGAGRVQKLPRLRAKGTVALGSPVEVIWPTAIFSTCALEGYTDTIAFATLEVDLLEHSEAAPAEASTAAPTDGAGDRSTLVGTGGAFLKLRDGDGKAAPESPAQRKYLYVYAYVPSLQQVQRTHMVQLPAGAHRLVSVPAAPYGPGGVLVCSDVELVWYDISSNAQQQSPVGSAMTGVFKCRAPFPRRADFREARYHPFIISSAVARVRNDFFLVLQDEQGDLYRVFLSRARVQAAYEALRAGQQQRVATLLTLQYIDTLPTSSALALWRRGYLFLAAEAGPMHALYKVVHAVPSQNAPATDEDPARKRDRGDDGAGEMPPPPGGLPGLPPSMPRSTRMNLFTPHTTLTNLRLVQSYPNTPVIAGMCATIPGVAPAGRALRLGLPPPQASAAGQQQQVTIHAVAGRGSESVLLCARFGYATRPIRQPYVLPAKFHSLVPLLSATRLQAILREQLRSVAEAQHKARSGSTRDARSRHVEDTVRALLARTYPLTTSKLLLCTEQGTTAYSVIPTVEPDTLSGFCTTERTLVATTLCGGSGYIQVTPRSIYVLGPGEAEGAGATAASAGSVDVTAAPTSMEDVAMSVTPTVWVHPHSKPIIAAAATPTAVLACFGQGGGIASFHFGADGAALTQADMVPNFPPVRAVSLLQPPATTVASAAMLQQYRGLLGARFSAASDMELAAIATVNQEIYLVNPRRLREPLEKVRCGGSEGEICSVLLTYLASSALGHLSDFRSSKALLHDGVRRLFCFVGYTDGRVTRLELDRSSAKVVESVELTCGAHPCQLIAGDGETVCYLLSGSQSWRCGMVDGVVKTMPWRFPSPPNAFARFVWVTRGSSSPTSESNSLLSQDGGVAQKELVVSLRERELSFLEAQRVGGAATNALEYSFNWHGLPAGGRRIMQHPSRPSFFVILSTEHRSNIHQQQQERRKGPSALVRSLGLPNHHNSTIQLFHDGQNRLYAPHYFPDGEAAMCMTIGSLYAAFGKEPIVVVGCASDYTHGAGCTSAPSWKQGWLRAFRCAQSAPVPGMEADANPSLRLELLHATLIRPTEESMSAGGAGFHDYPSALHICEEVGLLFVGMGGDTGLHIYTKGDKAFLRKRHLPNVGSRIIAIDTVFVAPPASAVTNQPRSDYFIRELYNCPPQSTEALTKANQCQLLVVCATVSTSVVVASLHPGDPDNQPSYLLRIASDAVPRHLTGLAILDERTYAVSDRFGHVVFLRLPEHTRLGFAEPLSSMRDAELAAATHFFEQEQVLEEIANHYTGQLVTGLQTLTHDPSGGSDPSLLRHTQLFYSTALGGIGVFTPFICEEDAALGAYVQPLMTANMELLLPSQSRLPLTARQKRDVWSGTSPCHHIVDGDLLQLFRLSSTTVFTKEAKVTIEEQLERQTKMEAARRKYLGLPPRQLPSVEELVAKQRALATLPV